MKDNFKTSSELRISEAERDALIQTLALFESGTIPHYSETEKPKALSPFDAFSGIASPMIAFDFGHTRIRRECGTVGCTLGWARHLANDRLREKIFPYGPRTGEQAALFGMSLLNSTIEREAPDLSYHREAQKQWTVGISSILLGHDDVTPVIAARALRSYLETGTPNWKDAANAP